MKKKYATIWATTLSDFSLTLTTTTFSVEIVSWWSLSQFNDEIVVMIIVTSMINDIMISEVSWWSIRYFPMTIVQIGKNDAMKKAIFFLKFSKGSIL